MQSSRGLVPVWCLVWAAAFAFLPGSAGAGGAVSLACGGPAVDFESGIPVDWSVVDNTAGTGIVWTTTADPACAIENRTNGSGEAACADSDAAGVGAPPYDTELVSNPIELGGWGGVLLDVYAYYRDITTNGNDRFEIDVWDGFTWTNALTWDEDHEPEHVVLNLSTYAGLSGVQVRFRYFGNGYDWYAQVDEVALSCIPVSSPVVQVDPGTLAASHAPDHVSSELLVISNYGGSPLDWMILEDPIGCESPADVPWLSVSPVAGATVPLDSTVVDVTFDTTGLAPGSYAASLCVSSTDPVDPVVQVPVSLTVEEPVLVSCNGVPIDFEDGVPSGWFVADNTGGTGIVWTTTADPACEIGNLTNGTGEAACADSDAAGSGAPPYDTELVSNSFDLSGWSAAALDVKAYYRDINTGSNDRFEVDVWDGSSWTNELSWDEDHQPEDLTIDLWPYVGLPDVRFRFRYVGNGYDWYAQVDDVALRCFEEPPGLSCNGPVVDFEDGFPLGWVVVDNTAGTGIVWTTTADPACGSGNLTNGTGEAACADSDAAGSGAPPYDTELWSNPFSLNGVASVLLDVKAYYRDISAGSNDRFEVDVWDGTSWTNELSWDEDHQPEDVALDLSAYAGLPQVRLRFRYFGNGFDYYAQVDDVGLACAPGLAVCDVDADGDVDLNDVDAVFADRGTYASGPDDPRDANGDGLITINDSRECVLRCSNPNCTIDGTVDSEAELAKIEPEPAPACGLTGLEALLVAAGLVRTLRARRTR